MSLLKYDDDVGFASDDGVTSAETDTVGGGYLPGQVKHAVVYSVTENKRQLFTDDLASAEVANAGFEITSKIELFAGATYPAKVNVLRSYSIASYADGITLKNELLA